MSEKFLKKVSYTAFDKSAKVQSSFNKLFLNQLDSINSLSSTAKVMLASYISQQSGVPIVVVSSGIARALSFQNKLGVLSGKFSEYFQQQETSPYQAVYSDTRILKEELALLNSFSKRETDIIVMTPQSLLNLYPSKDFYNKYSININIKQEYEPQKIATELVKIGYRRSSLVADVGEFSLRGDILDVYPFNDKPVRIEFWGDNVDSIRYFDIDSQRSTEKAKEVIIEPRYKIVIDNKEDFSQKLQSAYKEHSQKIADEYKESLAIWFENITTSLETEMYFEGVEYFASYADSNYSTLFDYLPENTLFLLDESQEIYVKAELQHKKYIDEYNRLCNEGLALPLPRLNHNQYDNVQKSLAGFRKLRLDSFLEDTDSYQSSLSCSLLPRFSINSYEICDYIQDLINQEYTIAVTTQYPKRIKELLDDCEVPSVIVKDEKHCEGVLIFKSELTEGFVSDDLKFALITDVELFNRKVKKPTLAKQISKKENIDYIDSINDLQIGDYVVHLTHGIGKYQGLSQQEMDEQVKDYLTIEYANADRLHIPAEQINLLSRYRGSHSNTPRLSNMGGADWTGTKKKVKKAIDDIAEDLVRLYATRSKKEGFAFESDSPWQLEMEDAFPFTETPDQLQAINDSKADMESTNPMDRLICGDVGFGKTEVATRAIFKAILSGKQVAVLVPTTILAQQHYQTLKDRFAPYPVSVELLSRFKTSKEQKQAVTKLATGECDLVVGTHRLLQKDISFKDIGLLVIDEEHRFGVSHKEKLKQVRAQVDVMSLSATPIPRTLYMSLSGVRDMSLISTPPVNRAPIKTFIGKFNDSFVKTAINYEIEREGQVYFLYNRVQTIYKFAQDIQNLVPNARIAVAHGQMKPKELEQIMYDFSVHKFDILICTTIIESGLDIPNANTMLIYDADKFGLAQLYQIRGRVGRSERQAYAYCFYRPDKLLTEEAKDRLNAIKDFTTLGSGYQIALRDLEIRGVGNILGAQQHGHMISVGFDVYCSLLDEAIKELQGEKVEKKEPPIIDINITAYIPDEWIGDKQQKMIEYKRLADVQSIRELELVEEEWVDRFGKLPDTVKPLIKIIRLRLLATSIGIRMVRETYDNIRIYTDYKSNEWNLIHRNIPNEITRKLKWTKAPVNCELGESILLLNNFALGGDELLDLLEDLFYYISKLQKSIV